MKNNKTTFSVIMPAYNAEKFIKQSISSVLSQTFKEFELIVVDDGSTDSTKKIINSFKDDRIKYIYQKNQGVSAARNNAIKTSKGSWLAFLDADDVWVKDVLEVYFKYIDDFDLVIGEYKYMHEKGEVPAYDLKNIPSNKKEFFNRLLDGNFIGTGAIAFKKSIIDSYFDEKIKFAEDYKLWLQLASKSKKIKIIDKILYEYRVHDSSALQNTEFKELELARIVKEFSKQSHTARLKADEHYNNFISHKISGLIRSGANGYIFEDIGDYKLTAKNKIKLIMYKTTPQILSRLARNK